jgi:hypothetical protein
MKCTRHGFEITAGKKFCMQCGEATPWLAPGRPSS